MPDSPGRISAAARDACISDCHTLPCLQLFQAVFGMTKKDLLDYIRAGSQGDLLNRRWWFQGQNSKDGQTLSEELEAEDRLEADKERAGSSTQVALAHLASLQPIHGFTAMLRFWQAVFQCSCACYITSTLRAALGRACHLQRCAGKLPCTSLLQAGRQHLPDVVTCLSWGLYTLLMRKVHCT